MVAILIRLYDHGSVYFSNNHLECTTSVHGNVQNGSEKLDLLVRK